MSEEKALEQSLAVIEALYRQTRERKLQWNETSNPRLFTTEFGDFTIESRAIPDSDYSDKPDYEIDIINTTTGRTIETISNISLRPVMDRTTKEGLNPYSLLEQIYSTARRQALKVDDALESLLHSLSS